MVPMIAEGMLSMTGGEIGLVAMITALVLLGTWLQKRS
jgi:hypothetical protein